jgi:hypothetical protein
MTVSITITDQTASGKSTGSISLSGISDRTTLRDLIRTRVREEVAAYNLKPLKKFQGLVMPEGGEQGRNEFIMDRPRRIDWEKQAEVAVKAFERNGFFVLVGGTQVTDLDQKLDLADGAEVGFVRLVPLIGG